MLYVVGFGSGAGECMTGAAEKALKDSNVIIGYTTYTELVKPFFPDKEYLDTGMRQEVERVRLALERSLTDKVALVCSGDPELYGMAALCYELLDLGSKEEEDK